MDVSAQVTMKDAAKCDKRCEWQNSANQENVERILHFQVIPESMSSSGLLAFHVATDAVVSIVRWQTFMCASDEALAAYRWRMKFNGRFGLDDHALCEYLFPLLDCWPWSLFKAFFYWHELR